MQYTICLLRNKNVLQFVYLITKLQIYNVPKHPKCTTHYIIIKHICTTKFISLKPTYFVLLVYIFKQQNNGPIQRLF